MGFVTARISSRFGQTLDLRRFQWLCRSAASAFANDRFRAQEILSGKVTESYNAPPEKSIDIFLSLMVM